MLSLRKLIFSIILFIFSYSENVSSQVTQLFGIVTDESGSPLPGAGISLLSSSDSLIIASASSDTSGNFRFTSLSPGNYLLRISFVSFSDYFAPVRLNAEPRNLGRIRMKETATALKEINVDAKMPPVQAKGDTLQYNSDAYKVTKDATAEDLVTKMPGVTIQDGKVQAQGEDVKKVLVDGKPFLGDDPNAALKNLPAESIDRIQVYDKKSDLSTFTGFDDGNTTKTINIITRPQFRNGTFGKVYSGYGTDALWKDGMNINFFKDKRKLSLLGNANNVNDQNFSADDLLGVIGTSASNRSRGGGRSYSGNRPGGGRNVQQSELSPFLVDQKNGIATTYSAGLNYTNQWKKLSVTLSYFYNHTTNNSTSTLFRSYLTGSDLLNYSEAGSAKSTNINHRVNLTLEYKFDTLNSLLFQPKISFQQNNSNSGTTGYNNGISSILSRAATTNITDLNGYNLSAPLLFRHSFQKRGRTFSLNLTPSFTQNKGETGLISFTKYYTDSLMTDSLNQVSHPFAHGWNNASEFTYTEPLDSQSLLSFTYRNNISFDKSDKQTFSYSPADDLFNQRDTSLSNNFENTYVSHSLGTAYRYQVEKFNYLAGISYQKAEMKNDQYFPFPAGVRKSFNNILPVAMIQFRFTSKKNLRFFYRSSNNTPTVTQLQNVINNTNPLQLSTGNPDLKQDWQNSFSLRYSAVNSDINSSLFIFTNATLANNYISNSTIVANNDSIQTNGITLPSGSQLSLPVNLNGYYSLRSFGNYSLPIQKIKSNLSLNGSWTYSRTPSLINNAQNYSMLMVSGLGFTLSSNISDKFDFTIASNGYKNKLTNSLRSDLNSNYYNLNSRLKIQVMPWKGLVLQTDITNQYTSGLSASYNTNYLLWNGALGYKFLKNRVAELRLSVSDILNKNMNVTRNTTETYIEDIRYNQLQRYFMLTFTYNLKFFKTDR